MTERTMTGAPNGYGMIAAGNDFAPDAVAQQQKHAAQYQAFLAEREKSNQWVGQDVETRKRKLDDVARHVAVIAEKVVGAVKRAADVRSRFGGGWPEPANDGLKACPAPGGMVDQLLGDLGRIEGELERLHDHLSALGDY